MSEAKETERSMKEDTPEEKKVSESDTEGERYERAGSV